MTLYFFDMLDGAKLYADDEGVELPDLRAVQSEAARSLVDMTKHTKWTKAKSLLGHRMTVKVRDATGPVLQARFTFEIERHRQ